MLVLARANRRDMLLDWCKVLGLFMSATFEDIPEAVIRYVRSVFREANNKASRTLTFHPSMHEESLDHILVAELTAAPPTFFSKERIAVAIESHWLGGRRMYGRWEIADIAFFVILRKLGHLEVRKTALLQTKRLYSKEIGVSELDDTEYIIGIGRIADRTDPLVPLSHQRAYRFESQCVYGAMHAGSPQVQHIDEYMRKHGIPVYYGLYNPITLPYAGLYPAASESTEPAENDVGCRVVPAPDVHTCLAGVYGGKAPNFEELTLSTPMDPESIHGWRMERFVADEVLRCRQGVTFEDPQDPNLRQLFYERSAPITAAIAITIDFGSD